MKYLILLICCIALNAQAKKYDKNFVDRAHRNFSNRILNFSNEIDAFFADDKHEDIENTSRLRISGTTRFREAAGPIIVPDIDYRLTLPRTEKRFRLFIEN